MSSIAFIFCLFFNNKRLLFNKRTVGIIYSICIRFYGLLIFIASFFNEKAQKRYQGQKQTITYLKKNIDHKYQYIWFHAASLGEFEQGRPIIEKIKTLYPEYKILLTFFSPSGYEVRKNYKYADLICYLPLDTIFGSFQFVRIARPTIAIFIKYEFWPMFLLQCKTRKIPCYVVSAHFRTKQLFFQPHGFLYRKILHLFTHLFVQDKESKHLLENIGIKNVTVSGDTRFDRVYEIMQNNNKLPIIENFINNEKNIIAGSSWSKDEDILIRYAQEKGVKIILAPHEIHENHIKEIENKWNNKQTILRYSQATAESISKAQCLIIDNIGLLSSIYQYGTIAYIGGGFGVGIHNTLEAATYGIPVVWGPNYQNFREAKELISVGGGFSINNYDELERIFDQQLQNNQKAGNAAKSYVDKNVGATNIIVSNIFKHKIK